ncbi:MAG: DUF4249 family protein [Ignavibacteriales bacterium]|nr:DUF4249 family protein [Ignavibacteriales bacterium]
MKNMRIALGILALWCVPACEENFSPMAPYEPRMVVYGILNAASDTQMVRVYTSYYPPDNDPRKNPDENPVTDAVVTLVQGTTTLVLSDTVVQRYDKSRYLSDIFAYYIAPVNLTRGGTYTLNVVSPTTGSVSSTVAVPGKASLYLSDRDILHVVGPWLSNQPIALQVTLSPQAAAYAVRFFMYFTSSRIGPGEHRAEVPVNINKKCSAGSVLFETAFGGITEKRSGAPQVTMNFPALSYQITSYMQSYNWDARFVRAVFLVTQYDESLFNYASLVNEYKDKHYIRADELDYTNIQGGVGIFGSMAVDTLSIDLPQFMIWPYRWDEFVWNCPAQ